MVSDLALHIAEIQDEYLMPAEIKSPAPSPSPQPEYLPPSDVSKPRAASTFGVPIDSTFADTSPYVSRKDANPYASRQQMKLPAPPAADQNPYQSRKSMALPKPPADQNPYASRQQMQLPKLPAAVHAPMAPKAPVAPASAPPPVDPTYVDTRAIFVQLHDAVSVMCRVVMLSCAMCHVQGAGLRQYAFQYYVLINMQQLYC